jgi:hypothetical protein
MVNYQMIPKDIKKRKKSGKGKRSNKRKLFSIKQMCRSGLADCLKQELNNPISLEKFEEILQRSLQR